MKPRPSLSPYALLACAWLVFAAYVWWSSGQLPQRVATHFGPNGAPNGWMTQAGYIRFTLIFGAVVPGFVMGTFLLIRYLNGWGLNIPHREYWLAPERRQETFDFVQRRGVWMAGLMLFFLTSVHYSILAANARPHANLPPIFFILIGVFLVATLAWSVAMIRHFYRKPA
jgi:uncharacterized membrane protein